MKKIVRFLLFFLAVSYLSGCGAVWNYIWSTTPEGFKRNLDGMIQMKLKVDVIEKYFTYWGYEITKSGEANKNLQLTVYQSKTGCKVTSFFNEASEIMRYEYISPPEVCVYQRNSYLLQ